MRAQGGAFEDGYAKFFIEAEQAASDGGPAVQVDERGARLAVPLVRAGPSFRPSLLLHGIYEICVELYCTCAPFTWQRASLFPKACTVVLYQFGYC